MSKNDYNEITMETKQIVNFTHCTNRIFAREEKELRLIGLGYVDFKAHSDDYKRRIQPFYTIHYVVSGKGKLEIDKKEFDLKENDVFAIPNSIPFRYYPDENDPYTYAFFEFNGSLSQSYLSECGFSLDNPILSCPTPMQVVEQIISLFSKINDQRPTPYFEKLTVFLQILSSISPKVENPMLSKKSNFINEIKSYIKMHCLDSSFSVSTLAEEFFISYSYLSKIFKNATNITLISYIAKQKMNHARHLLKTTRYSAYEICFMSGFNSYTHFLYAFKSMYGYTVSEFRSKKDKIE